MADAPIVTDFVLAFLDNDDSPEIRNPIHSTAVAREYGFDGPLVGGVTVWSWCTPAILEALGEAWLDRGWCSFRFRRPTYPGDTMAIHIGPQGDQGRMLRVANQDGINCVVGEVGRGDASWLGELERPGTPLAPVPVDDPPLLTLESAPVGRDWAAISASMSPADAAAYLEESHSHRDAAPPFTGERPRVHPGWLASRCESIMRHNQYVPSSMHTQSRLQFLAPAYATGPIETGARVVKVFERKGHHAVVFNTLVRDAIGRDLALIEHTTIFRIAPPADRTD